jgi:hypothetical protein
LTEILVAETRAHLAARITHAEGGSTHDDDDGIVVGANSISQFLQHSPHPDAAEYPQAMTRMDTVTFSPRSKNRLTAYDLDRFAGRSLFDRLARAVCRAGCLPRKELYEAWETARRVRRLFRGGRLVDLGGGHGLVAQMLLVLDDSSPHALVVDRSIPPSAAALAQAIEKSWPRLAGRVAFRAVGLDAVALSADDLVVSVHACGALTDAVLDRAVAAGARVAVLPCCHDARTCDTGGLDGWMDAALAIDATRAARLAAAGYRVRTQTIPAAITPKNRLLLASPCKSYRSDSRRRVSCNTSVAGAHAE